MHPGMQYWTTVLPTVSISIDLSMYGPQPSSNRQSSYASSQGLERFTAVRSK